MNEVIDPGHAIAALLADPAVHGLTVDDIRIEKADLQSAYLSIIENKENHHAA